MQMPSSMGRRAFTALALSAATLVISACGGGSGDSTPAPLFTTTVVFGSSFSDTGNACNLSAANCPPTALGYAPGRYSNGPLWIEAVAARVGATVSPSRTGGTNFAYAGARTGVVPGITAAPAVPSLVTQVDTYLTSVGLRASSTTLYVVEATTFGNNIADGLGLAVADPTAPTKVVTQGVTDVVGVLVRLYAAGARQILVINSANIGLTPRAVALGPAAVAGATQMATGFNGALAQQIAGLRATEPGVNIYLTDLYQLNQDVVANPAAFGLNNITAPCVNVAVAPPTVCATPATYAYWDTFHPTAAAGAFISQRALTAIGR
jgi:outer membrane lipase/esterase